MATDLRQAAKAVRENAHAPYSGFHVGAALRSASGSVFVGCNVENAAYPEGTCAEAGAIAAMVAAGERVILEAYVIADSPAPVPPCGGCRQKLAEFGAGSTPVTMATLQGSEEHTTIADLLPGAFDAAHMEGEPMNVRAILAKLRHRQNPTREELCWIAQALADGRVSDAQAGAFAMGVCLNGLSDVGRVALTIAMRDSGRVLQWDVEGPVLDKHSTGGVGDCVSLVLAPALAACGAYVPMISGRGLGHTGGTLDKLEAIPGVVTNMDPARLHDVVAEVGCAIVGASADIAPADKRLYAVRDVSSTVDSLDLITASILSKKLAAGLDGLVLDVKVGSGAFMKSLSEAQALAEALTKTANAAKCQTTAVISDMSQPLVPSLGNALEVAEVMQILTGSGRGPIVDLSAALGGVLLANGGLAKDVQAGAEAIVHAIREGAAAEKFGQMIAAMGGPVSFVESWSRFLPEATVIREVTASEAGYVTHIDGEALGLVVVDLGGGRVVESDRINPAVGLSNVARLGEKVAKGQPLAVVHATRPDQADRAAAAVRKAMVLGRSKPDVPELIIERVG